MFFVIIESFDVFDKLVDGNEKSVFVSWIGLDFGKFQYNVCIAALKQKL